MPTLTTTGIFDLTFDATFGGVLLSDVTPSVEGCRAPGAYLTWLSPTGWMYWLFEGPITAQKPVFSRGQARQGGTIRHRQKEGAKLLTIRTVGLSQEQVEAVATVYESIAVYLLAPDEAGVFHPVFVSIEPGTFDLYDSRRNVHDLQVQILLPARRSALS